MGVDHLPDPTDPKTRWIVDYLPEAYSAKPLPRLPAALRPPHIDQRIAVQLSAFTIHGSNPDGLLKVAERDRHARLVRLRIPKGKAKTMWDELGLCGVSETTVFPDLEGLARSSRIHIRVLPSSVLQLRGIDGNDDRIWPEERWPLGCEEEWGSTT